MTSVRHTSLIHITLDLVGGTAKAQEILRILSEYGEVAALSSVYKRYLGADQVDLRSRLEFVARYETLRNVDQLLHLIMSMKDDLNKGITLLVFDDLILMSPRLTLPYPKMHQDPLVIRCAAEVWGQYEHPVYEKNLREISKTAPPVTQAEFYMQGKSLVDF